MKSLLNLIRLNYWEPIKYPPVGAYIAVLPKKDYSTVYKVIKVVGEKIWAIGVAHNGLPYNIDNEEDALCDSICWLIDPQDLPSFLKK